MSDQTFFGTVRDVLALGLNTNSYKFALLRALTHWGKAGHRDDLVPREWLAERFLEFYWPLANRFRIRQSTDPTKEPVAWKLSRQEAERYGLSPRTSAAEYKGRFGREASALVQRLADRGGCLDEVLPRFHVLPRGRRRPQPLFHLERGEVPRLVDDVPRFLTTYADVLELLAVGAWVRFTEQYSSTPRLFEKLAGTKTERRTLAPYRTFLEVHDGDRCFYCNGAADGSWAVDHFLPWSFVYEDRAWNLVLACGACNSRKSDGIPRMNMLEQLLDRNRRVLALAPASLPPKIRTDLREWRDLDLGAHIRQLHATAVSEGFLEWVGR